MDNWKPLREMWIRHGSMLDRPTFGSGISPPRQHDTSLEDVLVEHGSEWQEAVQRPGGRTGAARSVAAQTPSGELEPELRTVMRSLQAGRRDSAGCRAPPSRLGADM